MAEQIAVVRPCQSRPLTHPAGFPGQSELDFKVELLFDICVESAPGITDAPLTPPVRLANSPL